MKWSNKSRNGYFNINKRKRALVEIKLLILRPIFGRKKDMSINLNRILHFLQNKILPMVSARRWGGYGFNYRPKPRHI